MLICAGFDKRRKLNNHQVHDALSLNSIQTKQQSVAVCIGGQVGRAMPVYLRIGLIEANKNFFFYLFYNLQNSDRLIFNTNSKLSYQPSKLAELNPTGIGNYLQNLMTTSNGNVSSVKIHKPHSFDAWRERFKKSDLDRIEQYKYVADTVLNM